MKIFEVDGFGYVDWDCGNGDFWESEFVDFDEFFGDLYVECWNIDGLDVDGIDFVNYL